MKRVALLLCMLALCTAAAGCAQETALQLPFDAAQVTGVEMYRFTVPADAEKKVLTQEAISGLCMSCLTALRFQTGKRGRRPVKL